MPPTQKQIGGVIKALQKDLIKLYRDGRSHLPLATLAKDSCSEASRLMAIWIKERFNDADFFILKGQYQRSKYHDVLLLQLKDTFYLIDPSVWQFFKYKRNILMEIFSTTSGALSGAKRIYGGKWNSIDRIRSFKDKQYLTGIIKRNISS